MGIDACMLVRTKQPLSADRVRRLSFELVEAFGTDALFVSPPGNPYPKGRHALEIVEQYRQDGPEITPEPGEQFIECHLLARYYGEGYERGPLPTFIGIAAWLEDKIPGAAVWYGGDSSGVIAEPFDNEYRWKLWQHFLQHGHRPYNGESSQLCAFCGGAPMIECRWVKGGTGYRCAGCGLYRLIAAGGAVTEAYHQWPDNTAK